MAVDEPERSLGHEIRSHLTVIKGYAQFVVRMLRRPDVPREDILTQAELLERHVREMEVASQPMLDDEHSDQSGAGGSTARDH